MRKSLSILGLAVWLVFSLFVLSSCGASRKVSDKQFVEDLSNHKSITSIFESELFETKPFKYFSHDITKRQTNPEKKEDIIYCSLTVSNDNYSVNADCVFDYNYYDEGGWVLDDVEVLNYTAVPTSTFSNDEVWDVIIKFDGETEECGRLDCIDSNGYTTRLDVANTSDVEVKASEIISENDKYIMRVTLQIKSSLTVLECYTDIPFDGNRGWYWEDKLKPQPVTLTKIIEADYQRAVGTFSGRIEFGEYTLYVESINADEGYANVKMKSVGAFGTGWLNNGNVARVRFDPIDGTIDIYSFLPGLRSSVIGFSSVNNSWYGFERQ